MSGSGTGIGGRGAAELRLEVVLRDGSTAAVYRLAPPWDRCAESSGGGAAAAATEATASLAAPAVPDQDFPTVARLVLTIVSAGSTSSISLLPPGEKGEGSVSQGPWAISVQIRSASRAVVRTFDASGSREKWSSTGVYTMCCVPPDEDSPLFSTQQLFGDKAVQSYIRRCERLPFPPLKLKYMQDFNSLNQLGYGTEGTVSKCSANFADYKCAVKRSVPSDLLITSTNSEPSDICILAELSHPNILKLHFAWNEIGKDCFGHLVDVTFTSMILCDRSLYIYLKKNSRMEPSTSNHIFMQIMLGLEHIHEHHIVHHDLKPGNILLDNDLAVQISDFGIAGRKESPAAKIDPTAKLGSFPYCAPELNNPEKVHDEKADIYSAGIIFFELYTSDVRQRERKVKDLSMCIMKEMDSWLPWNDFDLDAALDGTNLLDGWGGNYSLLKMMVNPDDSKRPSASEILEMLRSATGH